MYIFILILVFAVILSAYLSHVVTLKLCKREAVGVLRIDNSIPEEEPYLFLEVKTGVGDFMNQKFVTFEVLKKDYVSSQK